MSTLLADVEARLSRDRRGRIRGIYDVDLVLNVLLLADDELALDRIELCVWGSWFRGLEEVPAGGVRVKCSDEPEVARVIREWRDECARITHD